MNNIKTKRIGKGMATALHMAACFVEDILEGYRKNEDGSRARDVAVELTAARIAAYISDDISGVDGIGRHGSRRSSMARAYLAAVPPAAARVASLYQARDFVAIAALISPYDIERHTGLLSGFQGEVDAHLADGVVPRAESVSRV